MAMGCRRPSGGMGPNRRYFAAIRQMVEHQMVEHQAPSLQSAWPVENHRSVLATALVLSATTLIASSLPTHARAIRNSGHRLEAMPAYAATLVYRDRYDEPSRDIYA